MSKTSQDLKEFRSLVLALKKLNPSWNASNISNFLQQSENPPLLKRHTLMKKVNRALKRELIDDKRRPGRPVTVTTTVFRQRVRESMRLTKGASIRNVTSALNKQGLKCSTRSVLNAARCLKLRWYKMKKSQNLSIQNKLRRVECAKRLRLKFGVRPRAAKWKWNRIVNTDFSGKFTLQPFRNRRNDGVWAEEGEEIPKSLIHAPTDKFQKGIIFWGAISSKGLIPSKAPINLTEWLRRQSRENGSTCKYLTGDLYAKFIEEEGAPSIQKIFNNPNLAPVFQDDQDSKHRTIKAMRTVRMYFSERIDPEDGDAKYADVWPIENVWGSIKEKLRGEKFENERDLEKQVIKQWRTFTADKCKRMMTQIPYRLKKVIDLDGEQFHEP